jgi:hypothetical protein
VFHGKSQSIAIASPVSYRREVATPHQAISPESFEGQLDQRGYVSNGKGCRKGMGRGQSSPRPGTFM